ncbi:MAG: hypothetical protein D6826_05740 [Alphaproteobacteria bacterium]|nr:MAG: hypothetical protein D6826_05740 [Alphaproteobacteria bacterium]
MYQSLIVIDEFYPDPHEVRRLALDCAYPEVSGPRTFPGRNSRERLLPPGLNEIVSRIVGEPVTGCPNPSASHGRFRITLAGEQGRYMVHVDPSVLSWVGVVYLNLPEQCQGGTEFYRHRVLDSDRTPLTEAELHAYGQPSIADLLRQDGNDPTKWAHLMTVPMRFNRLILYRPWLWHSAGAPFGTSLADGRLVQLMGFMPAPRG